MSRAYVTFNEVVIAARELTEREASPTGWQMTPGLFRQLAEAAGFDEKVLDRSWERSRARDKFAGQVKRAFERLVSDGALRKARQGGPGPSGRTTYRSDVAYYTPGAWDAAAAAAAESRTGHLAEAGRWAGIHDRLTALGFEPEPARGRLQPVLGLDTWEGLLALAEDGAKRARLE
jgi:hypothetical protein